MASSGYVKLPSMPGAGDDISSDDALGQRTTRMGTDTVDCMEPVFQMKECDNSSARDKFAARSCRHLCY